MSLSTRMPRRQGLSSESRAPCKCVVPQCGKILSRKETMQKHYDNFVILKHGKVMNPAKFVVEPDSDLTIKEHTEYFYKNGLHPDQIKILPMVVKSVSVNPFTITAAAALKRTKSQEEADQQIVQVNIIQT